MKALVLFFITIIQLTFLHAINLSSLTKQYPFLFEVTFDEKEDIIQLSSLELYKPKPKGGCSGGIYRESNHIYYVKQSNPFTELTGGKLMNLIIGTLRTAKVKIIADKANHVASLQLQHFQTKKLFNDTYSYMFKNVIGEVDLTIAMDFLGLVDRHDQNVGYIILPDLPPIAARIDFDTSFSFDQIRPSHNTDYNPDSNHLSLELLYYSIKKYPKNQIIDSIKKITEISDEQIIISIIESYATLSQLKETEIEPFLILANRLIERKKLFSQAIESRNTPLYKALQKQYFKIHYKDFNRAFREVFPIHLSSIKNQIKMFIEKLFFEKTSTEDLIVSVSRFNSPSSIHRDSRYSLVL